MPSVYLCEAANYACRIWAFALEKRQQQAAYAIQCNANRQGGKKWKIIKYKKNGEKL